VDAKGQCEGNSGVHAGGSHDIFTYVDATVPDILGTLAGTAVGFYFGARK